MKQLFEIYQPGELVQTKRFINTPSEFAKKALFYVQETGYLKSLKSHQSRRSNLPSYLFLIVLSGKGSFTYQGQLFELKPFDCVLVDCMEIYTHQSDESSPWELLWIHFNGQAAREYYQYFTNTNSNIFHTKDPENYIRLINQIMEITGEKGSSWEITVSKLITDLLTGCIMTKYIETSQDGNDSIKVKLDSIKNYLDQNYEDKLLLDDIASRFYISKFHLSREFKRVYGITIVDYLTIKRINHAKEQLRFTKESIENIAAANGYPDASYFNKVFQKIEGMTGSEYRKKW
jgi:AraC-like DNA-binding protein/mannose-6-phosphate isomerase-like protein (cupin superfamily)